MTRQSWRLTGLAERVGAAGGPGRRRARASEDAETLLLASTGWEIPVHALAYWVRGLVAPSSRSKRSNMQATVGSPGYGRPAGLSATPACARAKWVAQRCRSGSKARAATQGATADRSLDVWRRRERHAGRADWSVWPSPASSTCFYALRPPRGRLYELQTVFGPAGLGRHDPPADPRRWPRPCSRAPSAEGCPKPTIWRFEPLFATKEALKSRKVLTSPSKAHSDGRWLRRLERRRQCAVALNELCGAVN